MIPGLGRSTGEGIGYPLQYSWASLVTLLVKNLPATWETWVQSLGWEDPLEKGMAAAAAAKSLQLCLTLCDPIDGSPLGSSVPGILQPRQHIKKQRHYFANKGPSSQGYGFSSGHLWM